MAQSKFERFRELLRDLFMFDQADLDFGIYRIINARREELTRFLDHDLLPQVREALGEIQSGDQAQVKRELDEAIEDLMRLAVDPETSPKVQELRAKYAAGPDVDALETQVFSDLYNFFSRYYKEGDFISLRRYKEGVYAIPYEGEEVKLHWANADQYYIKSAEHFRDYAFKLPDGRRVHFKLVAADTEANNNQAPNGRERRFILSDPVMREEDGELVIPFEYRPDPERRKQAELNADAVARILVEASFAPWTTALAAYAPTEKNPDRTVLEKHLTDYSARNTFDYFIHKDLGGFLRRELDFYIKSEVMHLDDIESQAAPRVEEYLARVRAIRRVALKIIDFLAQLEDFQKRLWLKKKFVIETQYCMTLDRVPETLYPEIAANEAQREEWVRLFAIDEIKGDMVTPGYSAPLTVDFLKNNPFLVLDTRFFDQRFTDRLLASLDNLEQQTDGVLIHSENFQALNLLQTRYREQVKCIYIDPPYNTGSSSIPYKNNYRHSSWVTLMRDRLASLRPTLATDGAIFVSIDKLERTVLEHAMDEVFGADNRIEELIWSMNTTNSQVPNYSTNHEYVQVYARDRRVAEQDPGMFREPKPGFQEVMGLIAELNPSYLPVSAIESELRGLYEQHKTEFRQQIEAQGLDWQKAKGSDPWKGLYSYSRAEYRDAGGQLVPEDHARARQAQIWVWQEGDASMPATKQAASTYDPSSPNWRFYKPLHPVTGKTCPIPKSGWKFAYADDEDSPDRRSFVSLDHDGRIAWGPDEKKVPRLKRMLHEVETNIGKSVFTDYSDGEKQTSAMFGRSGVFLAPKHSNFVARFILHAAKHDSVIIDCFAGSGSTAHAVVDLNRKDNGNRKYVLVEMAEYFDAVLKPRVLKAIYSKDWKGGKPVSREGSSHLLKCIRLESYEDALNNLRLRRTAEQAALLDEHARLREEYTLRYMLDVEGRGSPTLLNLDSFEDPFSYTLQVAAGSVGETRAVAVDLVETFNYLIGLKVNCMHVEEGARIVEGTNPAGERVLVIWRNLKEHDNAFLDELFRKRQYREKGAEFGLIYVNGDNTLENMRREDETWKVRLIEEEFHRLMFDVRDV